MINNPTYSSDDALLYVGDCLELLKSMPDDFVDLVMTSPPYEAARTYGIDFNLQGQEWVDWAVERFIECVRVCRGLVVWVVEGRTRNFKYSATPILMMADLHRRGVKLRKPPIFRRVGIPGSGGPDWLRNDYEFIICASKGKLPWSNNTAHGHTPKWAPGGEMSNRLSDGARVNQWDHSIASGATVVDGGGVVRSNGKRPSHVVVSGRDQWGGTPTTTSGEGRKENGESKVKKSKEEKLALGGKPHTKRDEGVQINGNAMRDQYYLPPAKANPGNVIQEKYTAQQVADFLAIESDVIDCNVGGGVMGSKLAHENEAPFPEVLTDFFIESFCPQQGTVLDIFCGSGTTLASAICLGRYGIGCDVRLNQIGLSQRRVEEARSKVVK